MDMRRTILIKLKQLERTFPEINFTYKVNFNLNSNKTMGEYSPEKNIIYFNMNVAERAGKKYDDVIIHEFAHMVAITKFGKEISDHGREWKSVMKKLNATNISAYIDFSMFIENRSKVQCNCKDWYITKNRLTRMKNGRNYKCQECATQLRIIK